MTETYLEDGPMSRRRFLGLGIGLGAALALGPAAPALAKLRTDAGRTLAFDNVHTGERVRVTYWEKGRYLPDALGEINQLLRDYRTGDTIDMSTRLLDLLYTLRSRLDVRRPYQVISGYRSPVTNVALLRSGRDVVENSLHTVGKAIDIRVPGRRLATVRRAAMSLRRGGVGYYPQAEFVHLDVGRVRYW
ncbi:MAG: DUF882 domain-containing protein [Candidatus Binatia bacterium]